jgi:8-amino-7-oxononanoate synthase
MDDDLEELHRQGLYRIRRRLQSGPGNRIRLRGRELLNFSSNDYLGLAGDPRLAHAASRAVRRYGCGAGASPLVSGLSPPLRALEHALTEWEGSESALVFSSGYAANLAVLSSLGGREDAVFSDAFNHASLIDGCRLSRAAIHVYRHKDVDHLTQLLRTQGRVARRRLIVSDSVFSMDGDLAPLAELLTLADRFDGLLLIDEAHATGVIGKNGRGGTDLLPSSLPWDRLIKIGTLSKALGTQGGFVCGSHRLIRWLVNCARPYIYSTALAPSSAAAGRRAVAIVRAEPERRKHVLHLSKRFRQEMRQMDCDVGESDCQIVPLIVGDARKAVALSRKLQKRGFLVPAIRPPSVPDGKARLRISVTEAHDENEVMDLVAALREHIAVLQTK